MASPRVILTCKHEVTFDPPPSIGDEVYCRRCGLYRIVSQELTGMIRVNCRQCPYCRYYGTDERTANLGASKHSLRMPTHEIDIERDGKLIRTVSMMDVETLPFVVETLKTQEDRWVRALVREFVKTYQGSDASHT